jgi:hypothetical protein
MPYSSVVIVRHQVALCADPLAGHHGGGYTRNEDKSILPL